MMDGYTQLCWRSFATLVALGAVAILDVRIAEYSELGHDEMQ